MTYQSEVLADAPLHYLRLDETTGTTAANLGSSANAGTISANVTLGETAAGTLDGKSMRFSNTLASSVSTSTSGTMGSTYTLELWYKKDTTVTTGARSLLRLGTATNFHKLYVDFASSTLRLNDSTSGTSTVATSLEVVDGNWHHIAVTRSGSTVTYYVDGVQKATGSFPNTARGLSMAIGSTSAAAETPAGWIDEAAYYPTVLTQARIQAHYAAGTAVVGISVSNQAPAASITISAPAARSRLSVPPMVGTVSAPAPVVKAVNVYSQTAIPVSADRTDRAGTGADGYAYLTTTSGVGSGAMYLFKFDGFQIPPGSYRVDDATLSIYVGQEGYNYRVDRITSDWSESDPNAVNAGRVSSGVTGSFSTGTASSGRININIKPVLDAWRTGAPNYGIAIVSTSSGQQTLYTKENTDATRRPNVTVHMTDVPGTGVTIPVVGAMGVSVDVPQHRSGTGTKITLTGAGSVGSIAMPNATALAQRNIVVQPHNVALTLQFPGGTSRNPDQFIRAGAMEAWVFAPNATQYISVPSINSAPPMEVNVAGTSDTHISQKTDRRVFVTTAMKINTNMVGIYQREADRYLNYVPLTTDSDDIWYQMEENGGTVALDALSSMEGDTVIDVSNGTYAGGPTFGVEGPKLRKAIHFDGVNDYVKFPTYKNIFTNSDMTYEFSLKTTQQNGVILGNGGSYLTQTTGTQGGAYNNGDIRLVNGRLVLRAGTIDYTINKVVADGEWHHVVISFPHSMSNTPDFATSTGRQHFVMVDGQAIWGRYTVAFNTMTFLPLSAMAKVNSAGLATEALAGDMRDLIVRANYAVSQDTARRLYYEWSESLLISPDAMSVSVDFPKPHSAKGNVKRMVVLYGLPYKLYRQQRNAGYFRDGWGTYYSTFAGFFIPTNFGERDGLTGSMVDEFQAMYGTPQIASNMTPMVFLAPKPFMLEGYMCYPVSVATTPGASGPWDAPGLVKDGLRDPVTGQLIDDATGLNRFLDVTQDLNEPITDYDAITAVNYPALQPIENNVSANYTEDFEQTNLGLNKDEWTHARDRLRDSILAAAYEGVNLWVTEPHMAEHLGFIQAWDKHDTGARYEFFGPGNIDATGYTNKRAEELDRAHVGDEASPALPGIGQYNTTWQANAKRQIVATEPGLTDIPSFEYGDRINYQSDDVWRPHAQYAAYDLLDKSGGLTIGDRLGMDMWEQNDYTGNYPAFDGTSVGVPRKYIVSARPQGVAGKVISKEMDNYYVTGGTLRVNPWRNNVYTIAAEKGTVVKGRPIAGRAFIEFMDTMTTTYAIPDDRDKSAWKGTSGENKSTWSFDSRRYKELVASWTIERVKTTKGGGAVVVNAQIQRMEVENPQFVYHPYVSMNARGLRWLQQADSLPAGYAKAYVPAMELDVAGSDAKVTQTRNISIPVTGTMRLDAELRGARNYRGNDVEERALPMVLNVELRGVGKSIKVGPMELEVTAPDARAIGGGDKIYVYMDAATNVTLFMKED